MTKMRGGPEVACWTAQRKVRGSNPGQGRNLDRDLYSMSTHIPPLRQKSVDTRAIHKRGTHLEWGKERRANGCRNTADTSVVNKKHELNPMTQGPEKKTENTKTWREKRRSTQWTSTGCVPSD